MKSLKTNKIFTVIRIVHPGGLVQDLRVTLMYICSLAKALTMSLTISLTLSILIELKHGPKNSQRNSFESLHVIRSCEGYPEISIGLDIERHTSVQSTKVKYSNNNGY